jgi:hypothetical protein
MPLTERDRRIALVVILITVADFAWYYPKIIKFLLASFKLIYVRWNAEQGRNGSRNGNAGITGIKAGLSCIFVPVTGKNINIWRITLLASEHFHACSLFYLL